MSERAVNFHQSPWQGVFYVTGGGASFLAEILNTPGASATVLEVTVPYAYAALTDLLGQEPEQATAALTARQLAMAAFQRAYALGTGQLFGFGLTAALATNREKRGEHRAHWTIQTTTGTFSFNASYSSDRVQEEQQLLEHIWSCIQNTLLQMNVTCDSSVNSQHVNAAADLAPLILGTAYKFSATNTPAQLLLPGSFNPLHEGHKQMLAVAEAQTGLVGALELTVKNADKPSLDFISLQERVNNIGDYPLWLTNASTFSAKSKLFENTVFALGVDTLARIGEVRFYRHRGDLLDQALATFVEQNTRFLVFGRREGDNFVTLKDLKIPHTLAQRCTGIDESTFRQDISSTELRLGL